MIEQRLEAWIKSETLSTDIDRFVAAPDVDILGLGEALHGGEEILQFRNRLFQRLVEQHGYTAIAIESSFPRSRRVNEFVLGKSSLSYDTIQDSGYSQWVRRISANRELVEWMRHYNATHPDKIHFYGFDAPTDAGPTDSPRHLLHFVLDYFSSVDPVEAARHRDQIDPLLGEDAMWENPEIAMNPTLGQGMSPNAMALRIATENLISVLHERRPEFVAATGKEHFIEAMHHASIARQLLNYHAVLSTPSNNRQGRLLGMRAAMMLDNLAYITSRERGKVLVFAHNTHLQRSQVKWQYGEEQVHWWPIGAQLNAIFGSHFASIASAVGTSPENGIAEPEANTLEALMSGNPITLLPTKRFPSEAVSVLPSRTGSMKNRSYSGLTPQHITDFDWLLTFASVTYHRRD